MKNKILTLIIGILIGAIIATAGFYLYEKNTKSNENENYMPQGEMMKPNESGDNQGTPPEKPSDDNNSDGNSNTPPEKPSDNGSSSNKTTNDSQSNKTSDSNKTL